VNTVSVELSHKLSKSSSVARGANWAKERGKNALSAPCTVC